MEFISLDRFMKAYNNEQGRPHTSIQDLTVSHKAYNSMKNCEQSDLFYSFFYDIKQWCGDGERYKQIKIIDQNKQEHILPKYLDIKDNEFDPVEIYAYYLGLFINNMRNGIYINYILSFPVTYEKAVKEKLLNSFTKGIKKSLPDAVLSDNNVMNKFKVRQGISEPAAYAICALKNFGLNPIGNQKIFYGIFDFGGGTTDFDFGLYRCADEETEDRYDYVIEQFGSEGDKFLGGENLLELLSFEIFKANQHNLRYKSDEEPGYSFFKPTECDDFAGSETLISNSQEAKRNTKQLMEALRPIWEGIVDYKDKNNTQAQKNEKTSTKYYTHESGYILKNGQEIFQSGKIMVDLFDKNGKRHPGVALDIVNKSSNINVDIFGILERRIQKGVNNFFEALKLSFDNRISDGQDNIHIFLAGNSSKSPILHKCFINTMKLHSDKISDGREKNPAKYFKLYYPLGTPEAIKIQKENKVDVDLNDVMMPTGKTGVAYGLIEGRTGGNIKVISSIPAGKEIRFNYYVGRAKRGAFKVILDRNIEYGKWVKFIDAGLDEFELYYSDLPESASGSYSVENMKKKIRMIDYTDDEADIYIRAVAPSKIEYSVAKSPEDAQNGKFLCDTVVIDLNG
ncbi:MAG: molecular chaperone DnaK [Clostridia bacterium]|nr:molecular chaperone DnaK [Clostridia bacterium]